MQNHLKLALDMLGNPPIVFREELLNVSDKHQWAIVKLSKNINQLRIALNELGYSIALRNQFEGKIKSEYVFVKSKLDGDPELIHCVRTREQKVYAAFYPDQLYTNLDTSVQIDARRSSQA
jgi:hypothetical protein